MRRKRPQGAPFAEGRGLRQASRGGRYALFREVSTSTLCHLTVFLTMSPQPLGKTRSPADGLIYQARRTLLGWSRALLFQLLPAIDYVVSGFNVFREQLLTSGTFEHHSTDYAPQAAFIPRHRGTSVRAVLLPSVVQPDRESRRGGDPGAAGDKVEGWISLGDRNSPSNVAGRRPPKPGLADPSPLYEFNPTILGATVVGGVRGHRRI